MSATENSHCRIYLLNYRFLECSLTLIADCCSHPQSATDNSRAEQSTLKTIISIDSPVECCTLQQSASFIFLECSIYNCIRRLLNTTAKYISIFSLMLKYTNLHDSLSILKGSVIFIAEFWSQPKTSEDNSRVHFYMFGFAEQN